MVGSGSFGCRHRNLVAEKSTMIPPAGINNVRAGWSTLLRRFDVPGSANTRLFDDLLARYAEAHRHYHNLEHVVEVLATIDNLSDLASNSDLVSLVAWYHDAI
jgi:predicted metal-dependent HD superfamily phosphohydrolase